MNWTEAQRRAIGHEGGDVLVAAGAGAGKTGVLTERVVRKVVADGCPVTDLLIVTFTDAAAGEMRRRVAAKLNAALESARAAGDHASADRIGRQIVLLEVGQVCTLHSFCGQLIREHFHHLGLDPAFEILDGDQSALVCQEVLDELLEGYYNAAGEPRERFEALLGWFQSGRDDQPLRRTILRLCEKVNSLPSPEAWWTDVDRSLAAGPGGSLADSPWAGPLRRMLELELEAASGRLDQARARAGQPDGAALDAYLGAIEELTDYLGRLRRCLGHDAFWAELDEALADYPVKRLPSVKGDPPGKATISGLLNLVKKNLGKLRALTARQERDLLCDLADLAPQAGMLVELCREYDRAYAAVKRARGQLDFADLERYAWRLLSEFEPVRSAVAGQFREVLVDEYQDISPIQDAILRAVAGRGPAGSADQGGANLFLVGDLKQSIYRFRLAEPDIFAATIDAFSRDRTGRLISLARNFRSRRVIIDAANRVFEQLMQPTDTLLGGGGPVYDESARLVFAAPAYQHDDAPPDSPVELHLLDGQLAETSGENAPGDEEGGGTGGADEADAARLERVRIQARMVGRRIRQLLGRDGDGPAAPVWDDAAERWRPARCRDVVILLRTVSNIADRFAEELTAMGLPIHAAKPGGYFDAVEVSDVRSLLAVLDNRRQDIPLAAVLRSPLMNFTGGPGLSADELATVRLAHRDGQFYDAVVVVAGGSSERLQRAASGARGAHPCGVAAEQDGTTDVEDSASSPDESGHPAPSIQPPASNCSLRERLSRLLAQLDAWRTMARRRPLSELLADIFRVTGYLDYVSGLAGGPQRRANLLHLAQRARQFDSFARQGLARFARFLDELERSGEELGTPDALSQAEDVIRIQSIHGAKGLEFPIVVLADTEHGFNLDDTRQDVLFHRRLLMGLRCLDRDRRVRYASLPHVLIASQLRLEMVLEEMRLLYVAMTRARERLVLFGSDRSLAGKLRAAWRQPPTPQTVLDAGRFLDWLAPAILTQPAGSDVLAATGADDSLPDRPLTGQDNTFSVHVYGRRCLAGLVGEADTIERLAPPPWLSAAQAGLPLPDASAPGPEDRPIIDALARRLDFRYPAAVLTVEPAKRSVSELKHLFETRAEQDEAVGRFAGDVDGGRLRAGVLKPKASPLGAPSARGTGEHPPWERPPTSDARARGLATHAVLQRLDLSEPLDDPEQVAAQVATLHADGLLLPHQPDLVDVEAVAAFFADPVGRLLRARPDRVRREWPFSLAVPVEELLNEKRSDPFWGDRVLVQGIIDVLADLDDGSLMVLDFKTDAVRTDRQLADRVRFYHGQMHWYARAAEAVLGGSVSRRLIWFLTPRRGVEVE